MRSGYLFSRFLWTAVIVAVPLVALHAWTLYADLQSAQERAYQSVQSKSSRAAADVDAAFDSAERLLTLVAQHPAVQSLDAKECKEFIRNIQSTGPVNGIVTVLDKTGQVLCMSLSGPNPASAGGSPWFVSALASTTFHLGQPAVGRITKRAVVPLSLVVRDSTGAPVALAVVSLDLLRLQALMLDHWSEQHGILALLNSDSKFLVRSPNTTDWIGKDASKTVRSFKVPPGGMVALGTGIEGIERVFALNDLPRYGMRVAASIPAEQVFSLAKTQIRNAIVVAGMAAALAALLAVAGARAIGRPMRSLVNSARAFFRGEADASADESLPGEFRDLASEMNAMYVARQASDAKAKESERRVLRLARFYEASSRANQAMSRALRADDLYRAICDLCVDTGQASMAWIGLVRDGGLSAVAWGGPAQAYTACLPLDLLPLSLPADGMNGPSVLDGASRVINAYLEDPRTQPYRENASKFNVRASAVVPFKRGGIVAGTLNLYADEIGFFDAEMMRLLNELADDISFSLDNLDKELALARVTLELSKREGQLSGIVESAMVAIVTIDASQRIVVFNKAAADMFQIPVALAIGQSPGMFMPERFREAHFADVDRYLHREAGPDKKFMPRHLTGLRASKEEFPIEVSTFRTFAGPDVLLTLVMRDITAEREAEAARVVAAESQAANRAKTSFLSRMSHELRTPLNAVLGFSQLLQEGARTRLSDGERHQLDLIFLAGAQLRALVDDVLDVSVIESGQMSLSLTDFELKPLLDGAMRMSDAAARVASVELVAEYLTSPPERMHTDPIRLRQVVLNLLSNAIKYNRPGGKVTLSMDTSEAGVRVSVVDTGLGMTKEQLASLFEPFNRLGRENSKIEGTGIGMTLVRQLVELMGGSVTVKSVAGSGTTVHVLLPRPRAPDVLATAYFPPVPQSDFAEFSTAPSGMVLYVEDSPVNVLIVQSVLSRWPDVQLIVAEDGASGIRQAIQLRPDVVLLDMRLPDMTGLEVLSELRRHTETLTIRVIALSASAMPDEVSEARAAGVWDYWTKPIQLEPFCDGLKAVLATGGPDTRVGEFEMHA